MSENNEQKIGRSASPYLFLYIAIALLVLILVGFFVFQNAHLFGEELVMSNPNNPYPTITLATIPPSKPTEHSANLIITNTALPPTPTPIPLCDSDQAVVYFLFIAKDYEIDNNEQVSPEDYQVGFADAIRMVKVDFRDASISMLVIPRDLMVAVPPLHSQGIYQERLKKIYAYGNEYKIPGGGASLVAQTLNSNFGFQVDHYVTLNFWSFVLGVESIGGIDLEIPKDAGYYSAGQRHLNGWQALDYARLRDQAGEDTSDASRRQRQTQVLFAIQQKAFSPEVLPKIPSLLSHLLKAVKTDLTSEEISRFICLAEKISTIKSQELSPDFYLHEIDAYEQERLIPDYLAIREFVQEFQGP
ncbi:MAG TPA: hypothetical protein DCY42_05110 [Chloroflexi bacterium]|nr:hypothetical protein [Chloroflexota bacterium]